jgi:hypothetical protein
VSFGGVWTRPHSDGDGTFQSNGQFTFSGLMTSSTANANGGLNMADFVLGLPVSFTQGGSQINDQILHSVGVYVQDVWRVSNRLTLNYGLRYEPYLAAQDQNQFVMAFLRENFDRGIRSTVYNNAPIGLVFPGDPGFPTNGANNANDLSQWAPRFGLVWDPKGDTRQTIRAGVGHFYDAPKLWQYAHHMLNAPYGNTTSALTPASCPPPNRNGCPLVFEDPWRHTPGGDPLVRINYPRMGGSVTLPGANAAFPLQGEYVSMPINVQPMQVTQWNLAYERQLPGRMMVDVTYMGTRTSNIWVGYEENPAIYIPGNCVAGQYGLTAPGPCSNTSAANLQARALLTLLNPTEGRYYGVNQVAQTYDQATGRYHSIRLGLQKRMSNGWTANANYTYSECVSQGEPGTDIGNTFPVPLIDPISNPRPDPTTNEGPCAADRPHNFNLSAVAISPGLGGGLLNLLTRDWQLGIIYQARSGSPITPSTTGNLSLTGLGQQRPMIVPGIDPNVPDNERTFAQTGSQQSMAWFNLAAFAPNTPGVWGDTPRGYLRGPGYWNVDAAFSRNLNVGDGKRIELRVEAFNLFDHVNWGNPTVQIGSTALTNGRVTSTSGDPRIMQFAVKYNF